MLLMLVSCGGRLLTLLDLWSPQTRLMLMRVSCGGWRPGGGEGGGRGDGVLGLFRGGLAPHQEGEGGGGRRGGEGEVKGEEEGFLRRCERPAEVTNVFSVHECFFRLHCWAGTGRGATRTQFRATRAQFPATCNLKIHVLGYWTRMDFFSTHVFSVASCDSEAWAGAYSSSCV